ncbi:holo-ACP synthase [Buchnera aphidicola (Pemphigus obesinymphae)]|uniref:holo-ACP synthase n=1 Tax=Buchnera aphidicola TaxID=9 RepID=UPI002237B85A|nr:holo-ACP synthase [Buchnera aphidicola]MCW5196492.1 holo-ACP synthase [Buchnera aphidicola (Pemphigus obesinymphae)]
MAIIGIGIDIIKISRIEKIINRLNSKLAKRILSKKEFCQYLIIKNKINFLAKRFAAKEAAAKALGFGIRDGIKFSDFEVYNDNYGSSKLLLLNQAKKLAHSMNIKRNHINLTDEKKYAYAIVIFESE